MQAELIYNPHGGQVSVRTELESVRTFLQQHGWNLSCKDTAQPGEATFLARNAVAQGVDVVIAAGGDGTVSEVANALVDSDTALGVLPVGTTNSWALQMGIPALKPFLPATGLVKMVSNFEERITGSVPANYYRKVLLDAARVLVEGRTVSVDVGEISGRHFLMWAGIGLDAMVLESVPLRDKKILGSWAYVLTALRSVGRASSKRVTLTMGGEDRSVDTTLIIISNIQLYGGMMPIGANARVNDGKLDVCIFKGEGFITFVQHALKIISRRHLRDPQLDYIQGNDVSIDSNEVLPVHVDGEPFTHTPVTVRCIPSALKVIIPANTPDGLFAAA